MTLENLTYLRLYKVNGDDASSFLQGQLSNDIQQLDNSWQYHAYCTPKGRTLATLIAWKKDDDIYLLIDESVVEATIKRLKMYVMRSKVVFTEVEAQILGAFTLEDVHQFAPKLKPQSPPYCCHMDDRVHALCFDGRYLIINFASSDVETSINQDQWIQTDIQQAQPRVTSQSSELFIPQMLNMDLANGISFKKGCYTGQEIIARMRYLGKLKQRLFVCQLDTQVNQADTAPLNFQIGDKIVDNDGKTVGNIANALAGFDHISAVLRVDNLDNGLLTETGLSMHVTAQQPYSLGLTH